MRCRLLTTKFLRLIIFLLLLLDVVAIRMSVAFLGKHHHHRRKEEVGQPLCRMIITFSFG